MGYSMPLPPLHPLHSTTSTAPLPAHVSSATMWPSSCRLMVTCCRPRIWIVSTRNMPPGRTSRLVSSGARSACSHTVGHNRGVAGWLHRRYSSLMWPRDSSTPHVARDQRFAAHNNVCAHPSPSKAKCRGIGWAGGAVWLTQQASTTWHAASNRPRLQSSKQCKAPVRPVVPSHRTIATPTCSGANAAICCLVAKPRPRIPASRSWDTAVRHTSPSAL